MKLDLQKLQLITGLLTVAFGTLTLICAIVMMCFIKFRKSIWYLKVMTLTIIVISIIQIVSGSLNAANAQINASGSFIVLSSIGSGLHRLGVFAVTWLISFKFWNTICQITFFFESAKKRGDAQLAKNSDHSVLNRNKIKGRKLCSKRSNIIGISVVSAAIILRSLFLFFEFWRRIEDGEG